MRKLRESGTKAIAATTVVLLALGVGMAFAAVAPGVIRGCVNKRTKLVRIVTTACKANETKKEWNKPRS